MTDTVYLSFKNICKAFPGVVALDNVSLDIQKGEIHALLGENGAGKSTLMNVLYGLYKQGSGDIYLNGQRLENNTPINAINHSIGMIHQHFMLIPTFTVLENIIVGQNSTRPPLLEEKIFHKKVQEVADKYNIHVPLDKLVEDLNVGMQQKVEILKALYKGADLLILDEPTSVLTPQESQDLFKMLTYLREKSCTIIFISHKLNEVMQISNRITVLRDGKIIKTINTENTNQQELSRLMVGRDIATSAEKTPVRPGNVILALEHVTLKDKSSRSILKDIHLNVCEGEILGIAGVDDNGQKELAECISGLRKITSGQIKMFNQDTTYATTRQLIEMGMSYIPADRHGQGLVVNFSIAENMMLETYYASPFTKGFSLDRKYIQQYAQTLIAEYDVRTPSAMVAVKNLSGGNQQKVIVAREVAKGPKFLLVVQPTWGLDIGAIDYVHKRLIEERDKGVAILLISTELEEVRKLSDRMVVINEGEIVGGVTENTSIEDIGLMMAGSKKQLSNNDR